MSNYKVNRRTFLALSTVTRNGWRRGLSPYFLRTNCIREKALHIDSLQQTFSYPANYGYTLFLEKMPKPMIRKRWNSSRDCCKNLNQICSLSQGIPGVMIRMGKGFIFVNKVRNVMPLSDIPWLFAWGNHDQVGDRTKAHDVLEKAENSLYSRGDGNGNYRIELLDEKTKQPLWQLFVLNSEQEGLSVRETTWLANESKSLPKNTWVRLLPYPGYSIRRNLDERIGDWNKK